MDYIEAHGLYKDEMVPAADNKKGKTPEGPSS